MQITRNTTETARGPSEWFTGTVYVAPAGEHVDVFKLKMP